MNKLEKIEKCRKLCLELMEIYKNNIDCIEEKDIDEMMTGFSIAIATYKVMFEKTGEEDEDTNQ